MRTPLLIVILSLIISPPVGIAAVGETAAEAATDSTTEVGHKLRRFSVYLGEGFVYGGGGIGIEALSSGGRYSIVGGVGTQQLLFDFSDEWFRVPSFGVGFRRYLDDGKHRFYAQTGFGPTWWFASLRGSVDNPGIHVEKTYYGNSLGLGYRYTSYRGFTFSTDLSAVWTHRREGFGGDWGMGLGWSW
jgi:hypothetical protein